MIFKKLTLTLALSATLAAGAAVTSLDGIDGSARWRICPQDSLAGVSGAAVSAPGFTMPASSVAAVVPGAVFTSYVEAGVEPDPDYADNIYRVDERLYSRPFWYRTEFATPAEYRKGKRVWINFDNTNRYADFWVNGHKVSGTPESTRDVSGHMMRSRYDITELLSPDGRNAVGVLITDADQKKTRKADGPYGVACSPSYLAGAGWDWMPYIPGRLNGLTGHVSLEVTGDVVMEDPWVRTSLPKLPATDVAEVSVRTKVKNLTGRQRRVTLEGTIMPGDIRVSRTYIIPAGAEPTLSFTPADFPQLLIDNPRLWWPNGYGDPAMYTLSLKVTDGKTVLHQKDIPFGIRQYDYKFEPNKIDFPVMTFYVNGKKIFVKGGNWGMSEYLLRCHGKEYKQKIRLHKDMNYNMIRLWTGCVTDDEFYDYCDRMGIMVWNDFWLYVAWNDVAEHDAFKANALDKVRRLRNHPSIALWCGANETHPVKDIDDALRAIVAREDGNDRMYKSCSNQDGLSGSGWWGNQPPRHHFDTSGSNLAFNTPSYPYSSEYGYGMRSEIGMATFPAYESVKLFIPEKDQWPLPDDKQLAEDDNTVWNKHFFGKEASNANPKNYRKSVDERWGESKSLEEFCEKAQLINIEDMKGMYEAWNDKMWADAAGILIWMSHPAYPSFVWQTYDYYYDPTGAYWGAKKACEPIHIQWNASNNSVKAVNTTGTPLTALKATAKVYDINGRELTGYRRSGTVDLDGTGVAEAFRLDFSKEPQGVHFIALELDDAAGNRLSDNFYWRNGEKELDYTALNALDAAPLEIAASAVAPGRATLRVKNTGRTVAFANRLRLVDAATGERVLTVLMSDNYITLLPGQERTIDVDYSETTTAPVKLLVKPYRHPEHTALTLTSDTASND